MARFTMSEVMLGKLREIAGGGKYEVREYRVKTALNWRDKAKSTVRHLLKGEQRPTLEEAAQIEIAHMKHCATKLRANVNENAQLLANMHTALEAMQSSDPEFFETQISGLRQILFPAGHMGNQNDGKV